MEIMRKKLSDKNGSSRLEILKIGSFTRKWTFVVSEAGSIGVHYQQSAAHVGQQAPEVPNVPPIFFFSK